MDGSIILFLLLFIVAAQTGSNFKIYIANVTFQRVDPEIFGEFSSLLVQVNNRSFISGHLVLRQIIKTFDIKISIDLIKPNNQKIHLFDVSLDGCGILEGVRKNYLYKIILKTIKRPSYMPECRFQGFFNFLLQKNVMARLLFNGGVNRI